MRLLARSGSRCMVLVCVSQCTLPTTPREIDLWSGCFFFFELWSGWCIQASCYTVDSQQKYPAVKQYNTVFRILQVHPKERAAGTGCRKGKKAWFRATVQVQDPLFPCRGHPHGHGHTFQATAYKLPPSPTHTLTSPASQPRASDGVVGYSL